MATERHYSPLDRLLLQADTAMRTLLPFSGQPARPRQPSSSRTLTWTTSRPAMWLG